jgi:hypothetical protein
MDWLMAHHQAQMQSDNDSFLCEVANLTMNVARPLVWYDVREPWPKRLLGGSCFILRFNMGLIGVTAEHVITAFETEKKKRGAAIGCLLRTVPFDLTGAIVDRDIELDIATFTVTEDQLIESEATEIDCRHEWPPPTTDKGGELSLAGFPNELKKMSSYPIEFKAYVNMPRVEDVTYRDIIVTYEPQRDIRIRAAPELPGLGANLSGCSGGPVLMHAERNGLHRWFPVGLILRGPRASSDTALREYDIFRFRRIHFVNADGSIRHQGVGWLP